MDDAVLHIVDGCLERARAILEVNRALLDETARKLLESETLGEDYLEPLKRRVVTKKAG